MKTANLKQRLQALFIDYLYIMAYLIVLALIITCIYFLFFDEIPAFTETQSHWVAFLTTTLPVTVYFTMREAKPPYATIGKEKIGLRVNHSLSPLVSSFIRNTLKFLPWHLGHYAVIRGVYVQDFFRGDVFIPYVLALLLPIIYILMVGLRKDHRHLPDMAARDYVIMTEEK